MTAVDTEVPGPAKAGGDLSPSLDITNADTWPEMLTVEELAMILRSTKESVRSMIAAGHIEAMRGAGRGYRISKRWVIAHILRDS